jgi:hypothetical protein
MAKGHKFSPTFVRPVTAKHSFTNLSGVKSLAGRSHAALSKWLAKWSVGSQTRTLSPRDGPTLDDLRGSQVDCGYRIIGKTGTDIQPFLPKSEKPTPTDGAGTAEAFDTPSRVT